MSRHPVAPGKAAGHQSHREMPAFTRAGVADVQVAVVAQAQRLGVQLQPQVGFDGLCHAGRVCAHFDSSGRAPAAAGSSM
jgi:hypothetical protein